MKLDGRGGCGWGGVETTKRNQLMRVASLSIFHDTLLGHRITLSHLSKEFVLQNRLNGRKPIISYYLAV